MNYSPKPLHLLLPALLYAAGSMLIIQFFWFSIGLWFLGCLAALWIFISGLWQAKTDYNFSLAEVAKQIREMNPEQWQALGIRYPELRIRWHGKPIAFLEDTDIRIDYLQKFIDDGDEYQFAPERLYGDGTQLRNQWRMTRDWLIEKQFVIENSASGNHSWLWRSGRRGQLISMYLREDSALQNLNDLEADQSA
jgi:hypothetical protein